MSSKTKISMGCDHGGFDLKQKLFEKLSKDGFECVDEGCFSTESVDYPDFAKKVCDDVVGGKVDFGLLVCTTGIGMSIAANKIRGIRAALCISDDMAKFSRLHNNANTLCIGAKYLNLEEAANIVKIFTSTQFEGGRHQRRVGKFTAFENL